MKNIARSVITLFIVGLLLSTITGCQIFEKEKEPMTVQGFLEAERPSF